MGVLRLAGMEPAQPESRPNVGIREKYGEKGGGIQYREVHTGVGARSTKGNGGLRLTAAGG